MIWRVEAAPPGMARPLPHPPAVAGGVAPARGQAGFTLLEVIIVLAILGLVAGIVAARGPSNSHGLSVRGQVATVVEALRGARGRAIAGNRPVGVAVDGARGSIAVDGGPTLHLPPELALTAVAGPAGEPGDKPAGIRFTPDGGSNGGRIVLADGKRRTEIGIDWLTGRVSVADGK
jgi:general secretion pathway protein H